MSRPLVILAMVLVACGAAPSLEPAGDGQVFADSLASALWT